MTEPTIPEDVAAGDDADYNAAAEFEKLLTGEGEKKDDEAPAGPERTDTPEGDATAEHGQEGEGTQTVEGGGNEQPAPKVTAADDHEVIVQVGDTEHRVAVKDLKRLFGQEASLTQKSQEVAEARRTIDAEAQKYTAGLQKMAQAVKGRWDEYAQIDWVDARATLPRDQYEQLRTDATKAYQEAQYFESELTSHMQAQRDTAMANLRQQAQETSKLLLDPEKGIPGWNAQVYDDVRNHAVNTLGAPAFVVNNLTDAWALKALHAAMMYAKGQEALKASGATPKPVVPASGKREVTSDKAPQTNAAQATQAKNAMARLHATGSREDAADAFMALLG